MNKSLILPFEDIYTCKIRKEKIGKMAVYDNFTTIQVDYSIGFTYDADAGEIARLLALNELNFILHDSVIFLSYRALTELLNEAEELWS